MNPERFARLNEIVLTVLRLPESERDGYLREACAEDASLRAEAESLIARRGEDATLERDAFVRSLLETVGEATAAPVSGFAPRQVGPYRLVGILGEGGMGTVYHARQVEPISREVALKLVSSGHDSDSMRARFESERQVLALMDHPNIARVLDAGSDVEGRPYFVMELVRGVPITQYCREQSLAARQRLELFADVCRAVRHAHRKGIIHRDLKPSNVLVTVTREREQVKVIDFGIAKALGETGLGVARRTRTGTLVGTVEYMSPEQARGEVSSLDVRSDVFSLGVIAFELLTDRLPFDLENQPLHEVVRRISEQPQRRLRATATLASGRIEADLETIVSKCLEKDPDRRYGSAAELTEDVERFLDNRPVLARPATTIYQVRLFARRHKALCGAVATVGIVLLGASVVSTILYMRAERARVEASHQRDAAQAVTGYLTSMLGSVDPRLARGREITVKEVLDKAAVTVGASFRGQDEVQASVRLALGSTYLSLGDMKEAEAQILPALSAQRRLYGEEGRDTLEALNEIALLRWIQGNYPEAERLQRQIIAIKERTLGPEHPELFDTRSRLGAILRDAGKDVEGIALLRPLLEFARRTRGPDDAGTLSVQYQLGTLLSKQGLWDEAERTLRENLEARLRVFGEDHPDTIWSMEFVGHILNREEKFSEAEPFVSRACEIASRVQGKDHPDTLWCRNVFGETLLGLGRTDEARTALEDILQTRVRILGPEHRDTLWTTTVLADAYSRLGRHAEAETLARRALDARVRLLGEDHYDTLWSKVCLERVLAAEGKIDEAQQVARRSLASLETNPAELHHKYLEGAVALTDRVRLTGRFATGEPLVLLAHGRLVEGSDIPERTRLRSLEALVEFYEAWAAAEPGKGREARLAEWKQKLVEAGAQ